MLMKRDNLIGFFLLVHLLNRKRKDNNNPKKREAVKNQNNKGILCNIGLNAG